MSLEDRIAILENIITSLQAQLNYIMTDSMKQKEGGGKHHLTLFHPPEYVSND